MGVRPAYQKQSGDLVLLDCREEHLEVVLGEHDDAVTAVCAGVADDDESVDVAHGQQTEGIFLVDLLTGLLECVTHCILVRADL